jgi:hypothetical protein
MFLKTGLNIREVYLASIISASHHLISRAADCHIKRSDMSRLSVCLCCFPYFCECTIAYVCHFRKWSYCKNNADKNFRGNSDYARGKSSRRMCALWKFAFGIEKRGKWMRSWATYVYSWTNYAEMVVSYNCRRVGRMCIWNI